MEGKKSIFKISIKNYKSSFVIQKKKYRKPIYYFISQQHTKVKVTGKYGYLKVGGYDLLMITVSKLAILRG